MIASDKIDAVHIGPIAWLEITWRGVGSIRTAYGKISVAESVIAYAVEIKPTNAQ